MPEYAVLSHTWGDDEISYLDLLYLTSDIPAAAGSIIQTLLRSPSRDTVWDIEKSKLVANSRGAEPLIGFGLTAAVSTRARVPSCQRPSTRCGDGITMQQSAMHIFSICRSNSSSFLSTEWHSRLSAAHDGFQEDGRFKNSSLREKCCFAIAIGRSSQRKLRLEECSPPLQKFRSSF